MITHTTGRPPIEADEPLGFDVRIEEPANLVRSSAAVPLSEADEFALFGQYYETLAAISADEDGSEVDRLRARAQWIRNRLVIGNVRRIVFLANRYRRAMDFPVLLDDLVQEGALVVLAAIDDFDWSRGLSFSNYAAMRLRARFHRRVFRQKPDLCGRAIMSLDRLADESDVDAIDDARNHVELADLRVDVEDCMASLPEQDRSVLTLRFGLDREPDLTLAEVGRVYGVTRERIRQIESRALVRLRGLSGDLDDREVTTCQSPLAR